MKIVVECAFGLARNDMKKPKHLQRGYKDQLRCSERGWTGSEHDLDIPVRIRAPR